MPTVSTVENTTSARFSRPSDESTVAKSPPYPPARSRPTLRAPRPRIRAHGAGAGRSRLCRDRVPALRELIHPVERVARRAARLELERRPALRRVAEEVEDGGHRLPRVT